MADSEQTKRPRVFVSAGEHSGDLLSAGLVRAYREQYGPLDLFGLGGQAMEDEGMQTLVRLEEITVTGIVEVIRHLGKIIRAMRRLKRAIKKNPPDLAILVDYPDFNLWLARFLKKQGVPILYFVSPQIWAWRFGRIKLIRRLVDHMLVLFPFEKTMYLENGVPASYSGHPMIDRFDGFRRQTTLVEAQPPAEGRPFPIALMPGSRWSEVRRMLPAMLRALPGLRELCPSAEFNLVCAPSIDPQRLATYLEHCTEPVNLVTDGSFEALAKNQFALVTSGTATLETALFARPMIIGYRMSPITYWLARLLVRVQHIGMVNLIARRRLVPELVQRMFSPRQIVAAARELLQPDRFVKIVDSLREIADKLGSPGVSGRQAKVLHRLLTAGSADEKSEAEAASSQAGDVAGG